MQRNCFFSFICTTLSRLLWPWLYMILFLFYIRIKVMKLFSFFFFFFFCIMLSRLLWLWLNIKLWIFFFCTMISRLLWPWLYMMSGCPVLSARTISGYKLLSMSKNATSTTVLLPNLHVSCFRTRQQRRE
jgi:hypothetical protein